MPVLLAMLALIAGASGCVLGEVDHTGQPCPCASGWTCTDAGICVQGDAGSVTRDAAIPDAPRPDVPRVDAGTACADGRLFCDGFEDGPAWVGISGQPWRYAPTAGDGASVNAVDTMFHRGSWSLLAEKTATAGGQAAGVAQSLGGVADGDLWARAWIRIPATEMDGVIPLSLGNGVTGWVHALLGPETSLILVVGATGTALQTFPADASRMYPFDEWFCLRLRVTVSDTVGSAQLFLGDEAIAATTGAVDTRPVGDFESVIVGIGFALDAQGPLQVYVDDVVVDTDEVFCVD